MFTARNCTACARFPSCGADAARAKWRPKKEIFARQLCWTITDTAVSSDNRTLAYSTISPVVRLVNLEAGGGFESVQNVTDIHEAVDLSSSPGEAARGGPDPDPEGGERFGVWSICMSRDGTRLVAGTSACSVAAYDLQASRPAFSIEGAHDDDVNAVSFLDSSGQVVVSGSDDSTIKLWDTRTRAAGSSGGDGGHSGVLYGHTEGVTCVAPRGDGRYLVSNGKDQKAKVWDVGPDPYGVKRKPPGGINDGGRRSGRHADDPAEDIDTDGFFVSPSALPA